MFLSVLLQWKKRYNYVVFFCPDRQASLNEEAEKYYEMAAGLKPNVSTFLMISIT